MPVTLGDELASARRANAELQQRLGERTAERDEAQAQKAAMAEVLEVINSSPGDLAPVFDAILDKALHLCDAAFGGIFTPDGGLARYVAFRNVPRPFVEFLTHEPVRLSSLLGPALLDRSVLHVADVAAGEPYRNRAPVAVAAVELGGIRTVLFVPLLKDGSLVGVFSIYRQEVRPFSDKQISLLQNFAAQAVIAMENARLLTEQREALEQQTAAAAVLRVINSSQGDLAPVFDIILEKAHSLCGVPCGSLQLYDGEHVRAVAVRGIAEPFAAILRQGYRIDDQRRHVLDPGQLVQNVDLAAILEQTPDDSIVRAAVELGGIRTFASVPLRKDGVLLGRIVAARQEVRPFTDKQIALLQTFAEQAVIAIENARLLTEQREALERQTASAEILRTIAGVPGDAEKSLRQIAETTARLFGATSVILYIAEGDDWGQVIRLGTSAENIARAVPADRRRIKDRTLPSTIFRENRQIHIPDLDNLDPAMADWPGLPPARAAGTRTMAGVPLRREGAAIGVLTVHRDRLAPFTAGELALLQSFADQAVIAIENARLLTEQREALEQQTATAEVLGVISSSTGELRPVFETMLNKAVQLCEAAQGALYRVEDSVFYLESSLGYEPEFIARRTNGWQPSPGSAPGDMLRSGATVHVQDAASLANPSSREAFEVGGIRTALAVPMMKDQDVVGALTLQRREVRPFTDRQVALVENFAAQAVIAIENARLLSELRQRTDDLQESLEYQTATNDVLKVISRSTFDLQPVLDTLVETAVRLCNADMAFIYRRDGEVYRTAARFGMTPEYESYMNTQSLTSGRGTLTGRTVLEGRVVHIADLAADPDYTLQETLTLGKVRTALGVPLLRESEPIGVLALARSRVEPFTERQVELVQNFADQAVIAIENARLLTEQREALQQQTATADVLKVISRSAFDLQAVLDTLVGSAARLCDADRACIFQRDGDLYHWVSNHGFSPELAEYARTHPFAAGPNSTTSRVALEGRTIHNADVLADPNYSAGEYQRIGNYRTMLGVPLLREGAPIGVFILTREIVRPFSDRQIELVESFADQAVIAIENARLFEQVQARTRELARSLDELRTAQDRLIQSEKMASLGQLTAGIAHEIKNPLNFVNNFAGLSVELLGELKELATPALDTLDVAARDEADDLMGTLTGNLKKIAEHGKRADGIVRSMLEHSRGSAGERRSVDINLLVEEALALAYHGARAQDQSFNITLERDFDRSLAPVELVPQDMTRVFLNLFGNGFYAASKRGRDGADAAFKPVLTVTTRDLGSEVEVRVRDNGTGIPPEIKDRLFEPFFTTKPTGEGTGLGLSISYDIVTQQHGGAIEVDSEVGEFTEFIVRLPRSRQTKAMAGRG